MADKVKDVVVPIVEKVTGQSSGADKPQGDAANLLLDEVTGERVSKTER